MKNTQPPFTQPDLSQIIIILEAQQNLKMRFIQSKRRKARIKMGKWESVYPAFLNSPQIFDFKTRNCLQSRSNLPLFIQSEIKI